MDAYKDYCFTQLDAVLAETDVSQDDFITQWTAQVATQFNLDPTVLASLYTTADYATYDSNWNTRVFWKYAASKRVTGTPTAFINGVML